MNHETAENSPLFEYDGSLPAMIEPAQVIKRIDEMPEHAVLCFFQRPIQEFCAEKNAPAIAQLSSEIGKNLVYVLEHNNTRVAITHPGVGAPLSGSFLEELIAFGGRKFIAVGGAGVLDSTIAPGHVIVPTSAIRDEGTSYHYLPPSREVTPDAAAVQAIVETLRAHNVPYDLGKTWTTDAVYRETPDKIRRRKAEGALAVEMEAAAYFAIAQFRGVQFGQMLYGGDDLGGEQWDFRGWTNLHDTREKLFWLAVEAATRL